MIDGIEITAVLPQKIKKDGPELLELLGTGKETAGVTTSLVKKSNNRKRRKDARVGPKIIKLRIENGQGVQKLKPKEKIGSHIVAPGVNDLSPPKSIGMNILNLFLSYKSR